MERANVGRFGWVPVGVAAVLSASSGCEVGGGEGVAPCLRDETLLAERHECVLDEDCPCGAHCSLGLCAYDCAVDADCGPGRWCNDFGRCGLPGDTGLTPPITRAPRVRLQFDRTLVGLRAPADEQTVWVRAVARDSGRIRFAARGPLEVRCRADAEFASECFLDNLAAAAPGLHRIGVRLTGAKGAGAADGHGDVDVYTEDGRAERVSVTVGDEPIEPTRIPEGLYRGFAWPVSAGLVSHPTAGELPAEIRGIAVPVSIEVFRGDPGVYVLALADDLGAVFPAPRTVGTLSLDAESRWRLDIPSQHFLGPDGPGADEIEVTVEGRAIGDGVEWRSDLLAAVVEMRYGGATLPQHDPFVRWQFAVSRMEPEAGDPPVATPYVPTLAPARADTPLAVETAVLDRWPAALASLPTAAARAAAAICTPEGFGDAVGLADAIFQVGGADAATGDLACEDFSAPRVFGLLSQRTLAMNEIVERCLADMGGLHDAAAPLATGGCIDATRALTALSMALEVDRERALGVGAAAEPAASALAHRLLQQWVSLAGLVGREAREVQRLNGILPEAERLRQSYTVVAALQGGIAGWDLLLHPRVAVGLATMPPEILQAPDYRPLLFPAASWPAAVRSHDQSVGLPVALLSALRQQLAAFGGLIEDARFERTAADTFRPALTGFSRRAFVVLALAQGLYDSARTRGEPPWQAEWDVARLDFGRAFEGVLAALGELESGKNPLGIEDIDLPLYRIGDETTAIERFAALSDYLLGTPGDAREAIAPFLVRRAQEQLDVAQAAWVRNVERDFQAQLSAAESERRIEGINRRYGERIISLCGDPTWRSDTVLEQWDRIRPADCFLDSGSECQLSGAEIRERLTSADVGYRLCFAYRLRQRLGPNVTVEDPDLASVIESLGPALIDETGAYAIDVVNEDERLFLCFQNPTIPGCRECESCAESPFEFLVVRVPEGTPPEFLDETRRECEAAKARTDGRRPSIPPASCRRTDHCPVGYVCSSDVCMPDPRSDVAADHPECFRGALGAQAVALQAAAREVDIARSELADLSERYDVAMKSCLITQLGHEAQEAALHAHTQTMGRLAAVKLAADVVANIAGAARETATADTVFSGGAKAGAAVVEAAAKSVSDGMQLAMDEAERQHRELMMRLENEVAEQVCFNDAEMHLVGTRTAALRIQLASLNVARQLVEFGNLQGELQGLLDEGHAALEYETNRRVSPLTTDFWLNEGVERYGDYLRQARRATYLAVLSAEYEFQLSSVERSATLAARTPADLQRVIDNLRAVTATGTVGGASPANLLAVVSLRRHLLQLADRSGLGDGWHELSESQRFRTWLTAPRHALYDATGSYIGQEIRFAILPLGSSGLGETGGIPLLTGTDCAERLWLVNASPIGSDLYEGGDSTFTRIVLRKRNTFFSQWCRPPAGGSAFQAASTRPSRNLFLDPYGYVESMTSATPTPSTDTVDETDKFGDARISAYFNVSRADFEGATYSAGASQELAGRGLYGEYALFFPAETLSRGGGSGLKLENVEDVLLRFDYVSVSRSRP
jgi:hypothetical protein